MLHNVDRNLKILIVDDSSTIRFDLTHLCGELGFNNTLTAEDGLDAINTINACDKKNEPVGLVLCDINMPALNGLDFLKKIRVTHQDLPVIMITIESDSRIVMEAITLGASHYILKPVTREKVLEKFEKILLPRK